MTSVQQIKNEVWQILALDNRGYVVTVCVHINSPDNSLEMEKKTLRVCVMFHWIKYFRIYLSLTAVQNATDFSLTTADTVTSSSEKKGTL